MSVLRWDYQTFFVFLYAGLPNVASELFSDESGPGANFD